MKAAHSFLAFFTWLSGIGLLAPTGPLAAEIPSGSGENSLTEIGLLEAKILAKVPTLTSGILAEIIPDGSRVEAGDLLARLDDEEIRNKIESEVEGLEQEQENLEAETHELKVLTQQYDSMAKLEKAELLHAERKLQKAEVPLTPAEIRLNEIDLALAELDVAEARAKLERQRQLVNRKFAPASSLLEMEREVEGTKTLLEEKRLRFELAKAPVPEEERLTLESEVRKARETVRRSQALHAQSVAIQELKIEGLEMSIAHRQEKLERLRKQLEDVHISAPIDGLFLLTRTYSWGARRWEPLSVGNQIWGMNLIGNIVDPKDLYLRVMIHESDAQKVSPGQPAQITLSAFPHQTFPARVRSVTAMAQDRDDLSPLHRQNPPANQALFLAILDMELPQELAVMPGMTATITLGPESQP
jgi:multidrug resistance efflux pump